MNKVHGLERNEQWYCTVGELYRSWVWGGCESIIVVIFQIYIWRSLLHYKVPVCCDVQCERRDLCALSEDTRYMHPNCSEIACWIFHHTRAVTEIFVVDFPMPPNTSTDSNSNTESVTLSLTPQQTLMWASKITPCPQDQLKVWLRAKKAKSVYTGDNYFQSDEKSKTSWCSQPHKLNQQTPDINTIIQSIRYQRLNHDTSEVCCSFSQVYLVGEFIYKYAFISLPPPPPQANKQKTTPNKKPYHHASQSQLFCVVHSEWLQRKHACQYHTHTQKPKWKDTQKDRRKTHTFSNPPDLRAERQLSMNSPGNLSLENSPWVFPWIIVKHWLSTQNLWILNWYLPPFWLKLWPTSLML